MENYGGYYIHRRLGAVSMGPPIYWTRPIPQEGSEIFLHNLPIDCSPTEVLLAASQSSQVYTVWMKEEPNGINKGFAFVEYASKYLAQKAVIDLNGSLIRGKQIGASMSIFLRELCITGLPPGWNANGLMQLLLTVTPGIRLVLQNCENFIVRYQDGASTTWGLYHLKDFAMRTWGPSVKVVRNDYSL